MPVAVVATAAADTDNICGFSRKARLLRQTGLFRFRIC
jgi:hypothetical protein